jgi:hypothetical protein
VASLTASVQQPFNAAQFTVAPPAAAMRTGSGNLQVHDLPAQAVAANVPFSVQVSYSMAAPELSATAIARLAPAETAGGSAAGPQAGSDFDWPLVLGVGGGLLLVGAVAWLLLSRRQPARVSRPRPVRGPAGVREAPVRRREPGTGAARYCHQCGNPLEPGDRFCRNCGTAVKGTAPEG